MGRKSGYSLRHAFRVSRDGRKTNQNILLRPITKQTLLQSLPRGFAAKARALYKYIFWSPVIGDFFGIAHPIYRSF